MTDLDRSIAAARKALAAADASLQGNAAPSAMLSEHYDACAGCADALRDLLAALDAARGEAVAWALTMPDGIRLVYASEEASRRAEAKWPEAYEGCCHVPLYAAPPAALAVPVDPLSQEALLRRIAELQAKQPAAAMPEDAIEAAYWDFDARHKGYGRHKTTPQSERDAFKWAVRSLLAAANKESSNG